MRFIMLAALITVGVASAAAAQTSQSTLDPARAAELLAEAGRLNPLTQRLRLAKLHVKAASLLPATDPQVTISLRIAAQAHYLDGRRSEGLVLLERAAKSAVSRDDFVDGANLHIAAAIVAVEMGDRTRARQFLDFSLALAAKNEMPEPDRKRILARIAGIVTPAGAQD
jgi:hypothetical protein